MNNGYGWLAKRSEDRSSGTLFGVELDPNLPTRWEEFRWARDTALALGVEIVLDAGSGYIPNWHILPALLSRANIDVFAIDNDPRSREMPELECVNRELADMTDLSRFADNAFDAVFSISVVEHVSADERAAFFREALRVAPHLVLTCDEIEVHDEAREAGWNIGDRVLFAGAMLSPSVSWLIASR